MPHSTYKHDYYCVYLFFYCQTVGDNHFLCTHMYYASCFCAFYGSQTRTHWFVSHGQLREEENPNEPLTLIHMFLTCFLTVRQHPSQRIRTGNNWGLSRSPQWNVVGFGLGGLLYDRRKLWPDSCPTVVILHLSTVERTSDNEDGQHKSHYFKCTSETKAIYETGWIEQATFQSTIIFSKQLCAKCHTVW